MSEETGKKQLGRPSLFTQETLQKLEQAFMMDFTDYESCIFADVSESAFYAYCKDNPDFQERKLRLKKSLSMVAKMRLAESVNKGNTTDAKWMLERRDRDNYSLRSELDGKNGKPIDSKVRVKYILKEEDEAYEQHINDVINSE